MERIVDLAYLAGLIDGEGSLTLYRRSQQKQNSFRSPMLSMTSTDMELVVEAMRIGGGSVRTRPVPTNAKWKQAYEWRVRDNAALAIITELAPLLRCPAKAARARLLVEQYRALTHPAGQYDAEAVSAKLAFEEKFQSIR